jgi:hypothetical protein
VAKLSFCQNDPPMGKSFWQNNNLVTHILFELCLFMIFSPVANLMHHPLCWDFSQKTNGRICFSILMTRKYLKLEIKIQVSSTYFRIIRIEKQFFFFFFWEVMAHQFYFEIYWPLVILEYIYGNFKDILNPLFFMHMCLYVTGLLALPQICITKWGTKSLITSKFCQGKK